MKKGDTIYHFLQRCLENLRKDFSELRVSNVDSLMYVKEDLIIPQHYTFYDFIINKARGKSGPLFSFDVHEDVRLLADATVEKDEAHAGKVVLRTWYERNKHIFPASRWEPYDPEKHWDKYTVSAFVSISYDKGLFAMIVHIDTKCFGFHDILIFSPLFSFCRFLTRRKTDTAIELTIPCLPSS